ncbi:MAG: hypothetical protein IT443_11805 [Phycisphaeraceae bacterium]|nr:hypothetical protein [Phycisphaeraceae bacterium]
MSNIVLPSDDGIGPNGPIDCCFYCRSKIGQPHKDDCVALVKKVTITYSYTLEVEVPAHWTAAGIEAHRLNSSWCAGNSLEEVLNYFLSWTNEEKRSVRDCCCGQFDCKVLEANGEAYSRRAEDVRAASEDFNDRLRFWVAQ